jgi:hypothetical protein
MIPTHLETQNWVITITGSSPKNILPPPITLGPQPVMTEDQVHQEMQVFMQKLENLGHTVDRGWLVNGTY